jgi:hypothetical protein
MEPCVALEEGGAAAEHGDLIAIHNASPGRSAADGDGDEDGDRGGAANEGSGMAASFDE